MLLDDLKKIFLGPTLFRLDTLLAARLVPILYGVGLAGLLLWASGYLVTMFGRSFFDGLWGLMEIAVFGALGLIVLRIVCEALLIFFHAHEATTANTGRGRVPSTLLEEIGDALHDIADEAEAAAEDDYITPATDVPPFQRDGVPGEAAPGAEPRPLVRRTARRAPPTA